MAYTVDSLIDDAKVRAYLPASGSSISDAQILAQANDELLGVMASRLMSVMQGYYLTSSTVTLTAGTSNYDIPTRAMGAKIAYAIMIDAQGNRRTVSMNQPSMEILGQRTANGKPTRAFFEGSQVNLWPTPDGTESLILGYYQRPGRMVNGTTANGLSAQGMAITGVTTTTNTNDTVTFTGTLPSGITAGVLCDIIRAKPHFPTLATDLTVATVVAGTSVKFTATIPGASAIVAGDWLNLAGESCAVQLPVEVQPLLAARTALRILRVRGDLQQAQGVVADIGDLEANLFTYLSNRAEGQPDTVHASDLTSGVPRWTYGY